MLHTPTSTRPFLSRREMLGRCGTGFGLLGLAGVLDQAGLLVDSATAADRDVQPLAPKPPHFEAKAKQVPGAEFTEGNMPVS